MNTREQIISQITSGQTVMGIEFGTTRIKAVLIDSCHSPIASGDFIWENHLENGVFTYHLDEITTGLQHAFRALMAEVKEKYGVTLRRMAGIGVSAMMHGYMAFDRDDNLLVPFRTWRNAITGEAAEKLTALFGFNIPQRWTIAHIYQAMLNHEEHVSRLAFVTTLEGYVHYMLTGRKVIGIGEGSGMVPVDPEEGTYDPKMVAKFDKLVEEAGYSWRLRDILPEVLMAGEDAGKLTEAGALFLDPTGTLEAGITVCPPEGDAQTGMAATNCVIPGTGCVSAGTSIFLNMVIDKPLGKIYKEIDMLMTPSGAPFAMIHGSNCTSDINAWVTMLQGMLEAMGVKCSMGDIYPVLFKAAMEGAPDCGGIINVGYFSGETITDVDEGRPMIVRTPEAKLTFSNFARSLVFGAMATMAAGLHIIEDEHVSIHKITAHGGFFKTLGTAQKLLAAVLDAPVSTMETAGEGGPWGMALLAAYAVRRSEGQSLQQYLDDCVFAGNDTLITETPDEKDVAGFRKYLEQFMAVIPAEKAAEKLK